MVYVLEILRHGTSGGVIREQFAQILRAAQRAARNYGLARRWQPGQEGAVVARLVSGSGERLEHG